MSINTVEEQIGMQKVSEAVSFTLKAMREYCRVDMSAKKLEYGTEAKKRRKKVT